MTMRKRLELFLTEYEIIESVTQIQDYTLTDLATNEPGDDDDLNNNLEGLLFMANYDATNVFPLDENQPKYIIIEKSTRDIIENSITLSELEDIIEDVTTIYHVDDRYNNVEYDADFETIQDFAKQILVNLIDESVNEHDKRLLQKLNMNDEKDIIYVLETATAFVTKDIGLLKSKQEEV